jgi:hypothetical protein
LDGIISEDGAVMRTIASVLINAESDGKIDI